MSEAQPPKELYLSIDQQERNIFTLNETTKSAPLLEKIFFSHGAGIAFLPTGLLYFLSWRAGFKGYGLGKFGKARLLSISSSLVFPLNGYLAHNYVNDKLRQPYRVESASYYGWQHALLNQFAVFCTISGPLVVTFLCASRLNLLPVPDEVFKSEFRRVAIHLFYGRVKPYMKPIAATAVASTVAAYFVGIASYHQSCNMLARMGRKTLCRREDDSTQM